MCFVFVTLDDPVFSRVREVESMGRVSSSIKRYKSKRVGYITSIEAFQPSPRHGRLIFVYEIFVLMGNLIILRFYEIFLWKLLW